MTTSSQPDRTAAGSADAPPALRPGSDALFLDYDGTLTEIVDDPGAARLTDARRAVLAALAARFGGAVAVLSGRSLAYLTDQLGLDFWRVGGHGDETAAPGEPADGDGPPPDPYLLEAAEGVAARHPGVFVEIKSSGLALHFRNAPETETECLAAMRAAVDKAPAYALQPGKMVIEARPKDADKGQALLRLMRAAPFAGRRPVMVGDDLTDEAAMRAALDMGGAAVKVGDGESAARARLASPAAVYDWMQTSLERT